MYIFSRYPSALLDDWIFSRNQQVLGMLDPDVDLEVIQQDHQFSVCKQLSTQNSSPQAIFIIASSFRFQLDKMMAFPLFSVNARWSAKNIADSIPWTNAHNIIYFKLLLDSFSEEGAADDVLTSLTEHFLYLEHIVLFFNDPRMHLSPSSFSCFHKFPHLKMFDIMFYGGSEKITHVSHENYVDLANSWATNCPNLREIMFPYGPVDKYRR